MMNQIKFFRPVQFAGDWQDVSRKIDIFVPTLKPGTQPVGMPLLDLTDMMEMNIGRYQSFRCRPGEVGAVAAASDDMQPVILRQTVHR